MNTPDNLRYTAEHEWVELQDGVATVGITDFAQRELGDIVFVEMDTLGRTLSQNEVFGTVEAVKTVSDLYMPVSGEIIEVNPHTGMGCLDGCGRLPGAYRTIRARWTPASSIQCAPGGNLFRFT